MSVMWCLEALLSLEAEFSLFHDVLALASVSTNLPWSCYCLEAPIPEKQILFPQLIAFIKVTNT